MKQGVLVKWIRRREKAGSAPAGAGQTDKGYRMLIQKYELPGVYGASGIQNQ